LQRQEQSVSAATQTIRLQQPDRIVALEPGAAIRSVWVNADGKTAYAHATVRETDARGRSGSDVIVQVDLNQGKLDRSKIVFPFLEDQHFEHVRPSANGHAMLISAADPLTQIGSFRLIQIRSGRSPGETPTRVQAFPSYGWEPLLSRDAGILYIPEWDQHKGFRVLLSDVPAQREIGILQLPALGSEDAFNGARLFLTGRNALCVVESIFDRRSLSYRGRATVWDLASSKIAHTLHVSNLHYGWCSIEPVPVYATGNRLYAVVDTPLGPAVEVWEIDSGQKVKTISPIPYTGVDLRRVHVTDDGLLLADALWDCGTGKRISVLGIYDIGTGQWVAFVGIEAFGAWDCPAPSPNLSADGRTLVAVHADQEERGNAQAGTYLDVVDLSKYLKGKTKVP
jgi:hypothetical protein